MARVLIVEDNQLNMELATDLLAAAGHAVLQAATAEAGIVMARAQRPDLILMDIRLPGMPGSAAVRVLKGDAGTARIPTVALTAQAMRGDADAAREAGFDGYMSKPIDTRRFVTEIEEFLGARGEA
ncbi:MAG TPA: response regulator [Gemmatimonadaceae bacterium]|nr:response regulator [Gemmatimonadaceae bacterium]